MGRPLLPGELESYKVGSVPTIFYIPDYLSPQDQLRLLHQINVGASTKWKLLKNRRLQNWGGVVHEKGLLPQQSLLQDGLMKIVAVPPWISDLTGSIHNDLGLFPSPLNHVLINEYLPGQGIMPHQDGPVFFPVVAILSLGSPAVMEFTPHQRLLDIRGDSGDVPVTPHEAVSVILMPGSLLVFKDTAYQDYLHGISECMEHRLDATAVNMDRLEPNDAERFRLEVPKDGLGGSTEDIDISVELDGKRALDEESAKEDFLGVVRRDGTRVSVTCRLVTRVHKNLFRF